ncbi:MAG: DUF2336 domain-containing protein [Beijerinckiaceae bacterium]
MLATLDALIQNGTGGRRTLVLRQICSLFMKVGFVGDDNTTELFDEVMANLAVDLDDEVVTFLAPEVQQMAGLLPAFRSTIASRSFEIQARMPQADGALTEALPEIFQEASHNDVAVPEPTATLETGPDKFAELAQYASDAETALSLQTRRMTLQEIGPDQVDEPVQQASMDFATAETDDVFDIAPTVTIERAVTGIDLPVSEPLVQAPVLLIDEAAEIPAHVPEKPVSAASSRTDRRARARDPVEDATNPITMARRASSVELAQIASLSHLPETITNVIVMRGERQAIVKALQNKSAKFSRSSLTTLAELAPSDFMIKQALVYRNDLPELIIERMLPFLNIEAKARLLISGALFGEIEARAALEQANGDLVNAYRGGQMLVGIDTCIASVNDGSMSVGDAVCAFAGELRVAELAMFAARILGLNLSTALNMLAGRMDKTAGILASALQCDRKAMTAMMDMRRRCGAMSDARGAIETHMRTGTDEALALVRQIDQLSSELEIATPAEADVLALSKAA